MAKSSDDKYQSAAGVTLIGVLFATLIFTIILIATLNLMGRTRREVGRSREDFIATNLAREGLELVQFVRDTNWLQGSASWTGNTLGSEPLCSGAPSSQLTVDSVYSSATDTLVRVRPFVTSVDAELYLQPHQRLAVDHYEHTAVVGQTPLFSRQIKIDCSNQSTTDNEHIIVTSTVTWQSRGSAHDVELRTHLYNWYQ